MMSISQTPSVARSSLEEMLASLRQNDEDDKPKDLPPPLPSRPVSRARLPSARRSLPVSFKIGTDNGPPLVEEVKRKSKDVASRSSGSFGSKKAKIDQPGESPYACTVEERKGDDPKQMGKSGGNQKAGSPKSPKPREPVWDDNIRYFIKKKLSVWCRLASGEWELGKIQSTSGDKALVLLSDGRVVKVLKRELLPANPDILEGVDDLIELSYLNEPSVLYNLQHRYSQDSLYTKAGPVLIAINPFKDVQIYGNDIITAYRQRLLDSPHVYPVADSAYNEMMRDDINQSIILSGESGAGKTETAKIAMQYLAALGGGSSGIENGILQTSCILEAFGNAKTSRNDNSSRFGKLVEIHFSSSGRISGARIQTFLLEKSRVVQLASCERSYHVFYQLCAGASSDLKERLNLRSVNHYHYLNQSDCLAINGVDDSHRFKLLMQALDTIRICKEDQEQVFATLAAVLWLGNILFCVDNENHVEIVADEALSMSSSLMSCSAHDLMLALSTHKIREGKDSIAKKLTMQQAVDSRDALAKFIYCKLFDWLVEQINKSLDSGKTYTGRSISIVDIYGFESFQKNSLEQFCINYANERLQQHFIRHLFKLRQEEYESDGIDWTKVDFEDNEECLHLFETKPLGLISLLDEESNFPKASDMTFANTLREHWGASSCFKGECGGTFTIRHYAGLVQYDTTGFLEKNRETLHAEFFQLLSSCNSNLMQSFASNVPIQSTSPTNIMVGSLDNQKQSVGTNFKSQLFKLMQQLENTTPHFIRCIKPNNKQCPGIFEKDLILQQLRCCGVMEVVRISRSGFSTRMTHHAFSSRYGFLLMDTRNVSQDPLSISVAVLQQFNVHPDMYQVGYTKLYFRTGQIARLENTRTQVLQGVLEVQKCFRGHQARRNFNELRQGVIRLQSFVRGETVRRQLNSIRSVKQEPSVTFGNHHAIIYLQSVIRGWLARRKFRNLRIAKKTNLETSSSKKKFDKNSSMLMKDQPQEPSTQDRPQEQSTQVLPSVLQELQRRVIKAEATLGEKEEENAALRKQLQQFETRWSDYEKKMKSMEESWQKQMTSLQASLASAKKSLADDTASGQSQYLYDSEDSKPTATPTGTPSKNLNPVTSNGPVRETNAGLATVSHLVKEFEQQKRAFDNTTNTLIAARNGQLSFDANPEAEFQKLKQRFESWKKDYKVRLREAKSRLHKLGHAEHEKSARRSWWGKRGKKSAA